MDVRRAPCIALLLRLAVVLAPLAVGGCSTQHAVQVSLHVLEDNAVPGEEARVRVDVVVAVSEPTCSDRPLGAGCAEAVTPTQFRPGPVGSMEILDLDQDLPSLAGYRGGDYEFAVDVDGETLSHVRTLPAYHTLTLTPAAPRAGEPLRVSWEPAQLEADVWVELAPGAGSPHYVSMTSDPGFAEIPAEGLADAGTYRLAVRRTVEGNRTNDGDEWFIAADVTRTMEVDVE